MRQTRRLRACLAALGALAALAALVAMAAGWRARRAALFYVPADGSVTAGVAGMLASVVNLGRKTKSLGEGMADWSEHVGTYEKKVTRRLRALRAESKRVDSDEQSESAFLDTPGPQGPPGWPGFAGPRGAPGSEGVAGLAGHRGDEGLAGSECVRSRHVFLTSPADCALETLTQRALPPGAPGKEGLEGRAGGTGSAGLPGMQGPMGVEGELCAPAFLRTRACGQAAVQARLLR